MTEPPTFRGPAKLPCKLECDVPPGVTMVEVPVPRHAWTDVLVCPNEGCGRAWLVRGRPFADASE